jgi:hypothetical protein
MSWQAENIRIPEYGSWQNPYCIRSGDYEDRIKELPDYSWYVWDFSTKQKMPPSTPHHTRPWN